MPDLRKLAAECEQAYRDRGNFVEQPQGDLFKPAPAPAKVEKVEARGIMLDSCNRHGKQVPAGALYIGRRMPGIHPSALGNPYKYEDHGEATLDYYAQDLAELVWREHPETIRLLQSITQGSTLACWCVHRPAAVVWRDQPSRPCHGDVIATMHGLLVELGALGEQGTRGAIADYKARRQHRVHELHSAALLVAYVVGFRKAKAWVCPLCKAKGCEACGSTGWREDIRRRRGRHDAIALLEHGQAPSGAADALHSSTSNSTHEPSGISPPRAKSLDKTGARVWLTDGTKKAGTMIGSSARTSDGNAHVFELKVEEQGGEWEMGIPDWVEYEITWTGPEIGSGTFTCPKGVSEAEFAGRMRAAVDVLNGVAHRDLALVYKLAVTDEAALEDHWGAIYWDVLARCETKADEQSYALGDALGFELPREFDRMTSAVKDVRARLERAEKALCVHLGCTREELETMFEVGDSDEDIDPAAEVFDELDHRQLGEDIAVLLDHTAGGPRGPGWYYQGREGLTGPFTEREDAEMHARENDHQLLPTVAELEKRLEVAEGWDRPRAFMTRAETNARIAAAQRRAVRAFGCPVHRRRVAREGITTYSTPAARHWHRSFGMLVDRLLAHGEVNTAIAFDAQFVDAIGLRRGEVVELRERGGMFRMYARWGAVAATRLVTEEALRDGHFPLERLFAEMLDRVRELALNPGSVSGPVSSAATIAVEYRWMNMADRR